LQPSRGLKFRDEVHFRALTKLLTDPPARKDAGQCPKRLTKGLGREPDRREIHPLFQRRVEAHAAFPIRLARISPRPKWNFFFLDDATPLWQVSCDCGGIATATIGATFYQGKRL
jgi:hypothetical protein